MSLSVDNWVNSNATNAGSLASGSLTASNAGDILLACVTAEWATSVGASGTISGITDTAGLTWTKRAGSQVQTTGGSYNGFMDAEVWWAYAPTTLSGFVATVNFTLPSAHNFDGAALVLIAVTGFTGTLYPTNPWDSNSSLPALAASNSSTTPTVSISTTAADTFIFGVGAATSTPFTSFAASPGSGYSTTPGPGYTATYANSGNYSSISVESQAVSSVKTAFAVDYAGSIQGWALIADALAMAGNPPPPPPTGPTLDGFASGSTGACNLTTTQANDIVVAVVGLYTNNAYSDPSLAVSGGGLTWTRRSVVHQTDTTYGNPQIFEVWWAKAASPLTAAAISASPVNGGGVNYYELVAFGVSGADQTNPFDPNSSLPAIVGSPGTGSGSHPVAGISTTSANAFVFAALAFSVNAPTTSTPDSGFTLLGSVAGSYNSISVEGEVISAALAGVTQNVFAAFSTYTNNYIAYVDAIQAPGAAPSTSGALAAIEGGDTAAFSGSVTLTTNTGTLAAIDTPDAAAFFGSGVTPPRINFLEAYENADRARFSGRFITYGALGAVETPDSAFFTNINYGRLVARESPDRWLTVARTSGVLAAIDTPDRARFTVYQQAGAIGEEPMTEIIELVLPDNIERDAKGGPVFNTSVFTGANGAEYRSINWPRQFGKWAISLGYRDDRDPDYLAVLNLFYACRGRGYGFRFRDWADYRMVDSPLGQPLTTGGPLQIQKVYSAGTNTYARKITRPKVGTAIIKTAGGALVPGAVIDYTTGLVSGASLGDTCTCEFDVPVRFDTDALQIDVEHDGLVNCPSLDLVELQE